MRFKYTYLVFLLSSIVMTSCLLFQPNFKEIWAKNSKQQYDVIIVPGIPFEPPTWNPIMKMRVHWSAYLYKQGIAKNIIYSGGAVHSPYLESKIMSLYAQKLGVPKENIYLESKAEHGSENLFYSTVLADSLGFEKIALATDVYQGSLMFKHNRKFDLNLPFLPAMMDTLITLDMYMPEIDYEQAKVENFVKLNERVGKIEQYQNSMGRRIKKESKARKKTKKGAKKEVKTTN